MQKWTIRYECLNSKGEVEIKETELYAVNVFGAYANASRLLPIIERGKEIKKIEVLNYG